MKGVTRLQLSPRLSQWNWIGSEDAT